MSKKLFVIFAIFAGLLSLVALRNALKSEPPDILDVLKITRMVPKGLTEKDVSKIVLEHRKQDKSQKIVLFKEQGLWKLQTAFNAPGDDEKISDFLSNIVKLDGEYRIEDKNLLGDFELKDDQAIHMQIYSSSAGKENLEAHLLIGKRSGEVANFVRSVDSDKVYTVGSDLRQQVGAYWSDNVELTNEHWLNKIVLRFSKERVHKISLKYPDKEIVLAKVEKKIEKKNNDKSKEDEQNQQDKPKDDKEEQTENSKKDEKDKEPKVIYEWKLISGGFGKDLKSDVIDSLLQNLTEFKCADVVDPSKKAEWGLEKPSFRAEIVLKSGKTEVLLGSLDKDNAYCYIEDNPELVYKLQTFTFTSLFKNGDKFFELPTISVKKDNVVQVELQQNNTKVILGRKKNGDKYEWSVVSGAEGTLEKSVADNILDTLSQLTVEDYSDTKDKAVLGITEANQLVVTLDDGKKHVLQFGNARSQGGQYLSYNDQTPLYGIGKYDYEQLFPGVDKLIKKPQVKKSTEEGDSEKGDSGTTEDNSQDTDDSSTQENPKDSSDKNDSEKAETSENK